MITTREVRCTVVLADSGASATKTVSGPRFRPSDLLPWADPHIRSLVEQLQDEVREEETERPSLRRFDEQLLQTVAATL